MRRQRSLDNKDNHNVIVNTSIPAIIFDSILRLIIDLLWKQEVDAIKSGWYSNALEAITICVVKALLFWPFMCCTVYHSLIKSRLFLFLQKVKKTHINEPVRGAIIESMQHHGQGVYSGTFSGKPFLVNSHYWTNNTAPGVGGPSSELGR